MSFNKRFQQTILIFILLLALYLRLGHLTEVLTILPQKNILCGGDGATYDRQAQDILIGAWPGNEVLGHVPLYSFYLATIYSITGVNYVTPLLVQILFEVAMCAVAYWIGKYAYSSLVGMFTALGVALYGSLIIYQICYAPVALTTPLLVFTIYFVFKYYYTGRFYYLAVAAVTLGLCALSRPTMLIVFPVINFWLFVQSGNRHRFVKEGLLLALFFSLTLLPTTLHNYRVSGDFIPISNQGPLNFYFGNSASSSGIGPHGMASQYGEKIQSNMRFVAEYEKIEHEVEQGKTTYLEQTTSYIIQHPAEWLDLMIQKVYLMFVEPDWKLILTSFEYPASSVALKESPYLQYFPVEWSALIVMSLLCLIFVRNRATLFFWFITLAVSTATILFFVKFRFRLPLAPLLIMMSFAVTSKSVDWFRADRFKFFIVLVILCALSPFVPSIFIFLALYVLPALFFSLGETSIWRLKWILIAFWCYVVIVWLGIQMISLRENNSQTQNYFSGPEIWGDAIIGQTIIPDCNGLFQIELEFSRVNYTHNQPYYFHLAKDKDLNQEIYSTKFHIEDVTKWTRKTFTFPPQFDSMQQTYFFYIHSPTSHPGNAITVRLYPDLPTIYNRYKDGEILAGTRDALQSIPGDLTFSAYCQETILDLLERTIDQISDSKLLFIDYSPFYYFFFFLHGGLLLVALLKIGQEYFF